MKIHVLLSSPSWIVNSNDSICLGKSICISPFGLFLYMVSLKLFNMLDVP